jgi:hypothetical protein
MRHRWQVGRIVSYISEIVGSLSEERECGQLHNQLSFQLLLFPSQLGSYLRCHFVSLYSCTEHSTESMKKP